MAIRLTERNGGKILEACVSGKLTHADYKRFVPEFVRLIKQHGKINVLFEMVGFRGWKAGALWDDIKLDLKYFADIERLAMVGEKKWQKGMSKFCHPFTAARIRYFDRTAANEARNWLAGESDLADVWQEPVLRVFQSRAQTKAFYNKISRFYDALSDRSEAPVRKAGLDLLRPRAGERILEIGFGTGHTLAVLAKAIGSAGMVYGLDLSDQMVRLAKKDLAEAGLLEKARLRCGDAVRLPYAANTMDAVFMSFTLELFDTPEIPKVLSECRRVLKTDGRIVVVGMSKEGKHEPLIGVFEWAHKHFPNFIDCRPIFVRKALEKADFQIRKALKKHMWIPVEIILGAKS
ncbi:MAG TPA: STAS/SEC14 domain-containing protein [Acidobacteriota bacterium]|nr:STAS/SEC14 domain-containing protein [Acidobacteriota bacterium]